MSNNKKNIHHAETHKSNKAEVRAAEAAEKSYEKQMKRHAQYREARYGASRTVIPAQPLPAFLQSLKGMDYFMYPGEKILYGKRPVSPQFPQNY